MAPPRRHQQKKDYKMAVTAILVMLAAAISPVILVVGLVLRWHPVLLFWPGLFTVVTIAFFVWTSHLGRADDWAEAKQRPGWTITREPDQGVLDELWQGDPPPITLQGQTVRTLARGTVEGRAVSILDLVNRRGSRTEYVLVHLDGWLPPFQVSPQVELMPHRDATHVEDHEFNTWFDVDTFDKKATEATAYAHALLTPRALEHLQSRRNEGFHRVRGRFLEADVTCFAHEIGTVEKEIAHLVRFVSTIEPWVYQQWSRSAMQTRGWDVTRWDGKGIRS